MNILFVCLDHYPFSGACTSLLQNILKEGTMQSSLGEVHVLTIKRKWTERETEEIDGVTIHRFLPYSWLPSHEITMMLQQGAIGHAVRTICAKLSVKCRARLLRERELFQKNIFRTLAKRIKQLSSEVSFDVIVPVCGYYETAAAVMQCIPSIDSKIVLYQVDPCSSNVNYGDNLMKPAREFEERMYRVSDAIITTPIIFQEIISKYSPDIVKKAHAMEFPNITAEDRPIKIEEHKEIRCVFAGGLYPGTRNPRHTINVFNKLNDTSIELILVGADKSSMSAFMEETEVGDKVVFLGKLPLEKAREEIGRADILINIGNIMTNQIPSKIFEYISACKPIINVCANENCPSIPYLEKYPLALTIVEGVGSLEEHVAQIEKFIAENAGRTVEKTLVLEQYAACTAAYCAKQMSRIVKSVLYEESAENEQVSNNSQQ